jgi:hypothetical protein
VAIIGNYSDLTFAEGGQAATIESDARRKFDCGDAPLVVQAIWPQLAAPIRADLEYRLAVKHRGRRTSAAIGLLMG